MKKQIHFRTTESQVLINGKAITSTQQVNKLPAYQLETYNKLHDDLAKKAFRRLEYSAKRIYLHLYQTIFKNYPLESEEDLELKYIQLLEKIEPIFKTKQIYKIYRHIALRDNIFNESQALPKEYYKAKKAIMKRPVLPTSYEIRRQETKIIEYLKDFKP